MDKGKAERYVQNNQSFGGKKKQRKGKEKREPENRSLRLRMLLTEALNQRHSEKVPSDEDLESAINTRESEEREGPV